MRKGTKNFSDNKSAKDLLQFFDGKCRRESHFGAAGTATAPATAPRREGAPRKRQKRSKNGTGAPWEQQRPVKERSRSAAKTSKTAARTAGCHRTNGRKPARHGTKKEGRNTSGPPVGETRFAIRGTRAGYQQQRPSQRRRPRSGPWRASAGSCRDSRADLRSARHGRPSARPTRLRNRSAG